MSNVFAPSIIAEAVAASTISAGQVTADGPGFSVVEDALVNLDNEVESGGNVVAMTNTKPSGNKFGQCLGASGDYFSTPDSVANSITGDMEIVARLAPDDWSAAAGTNTIIAKRTVGQEAFQLRIVAGGLIQFVFWDSASSTVSASTVGFGFDDGTAHWVKMTFDANNGAAGNTTTFYTSNDGVSWTQLGDPVVKAGDVTIDDTTAAIEVGAYLGGTGNLLVGSIYRAQIYNGIDPETQTLAVDFNPNDYANTGNTNWASSATGEVWSVNGNNYVVTPRALVGTGAPWGDLPGAVGDYFSTPDSVANSVTGDIDIRVKVAMDDWTPAASGSPISKYATVGQRSFQLAINTGGTISFTLSADGTSGTTATSSASSGVADGAASWIRATWNATTKDVYFYKSGDAITWSAVGTVQTLNVSSVFDGTSVIEVGTTQGGLAPIAGKVHRAQILNGIDGPVVVDLDPIMHTNGTTFNGRTGEKWTANGNAAIHGYDVNTVVGTGANLKKSVSGAALLYGASGDYIATPNAAANQITGDIDIRMYDVAAADWTPTGFQTLLARLANVSTQRSYWLDIRATDGHLLFNSTSDGTAGTLVQSACTVPTGFTDGAANDLRVTCDVNNGAGGRDVKFWVPGTSITLADGTSWDQLGATVTTGTTAAIFAGTSPLEIGSITGGTGQIFNGRVGRAQIYNGIDGTLAVDFNATDAGNTGATSFNSDLMAIDLPGAVGDYGSTPDSVAASITGDIDIRVRCAADDWTPAADKTILGKYLGTGDQRSYRFTLDSTNVLQLAITTDGTAGTAITYASSIAPSVSDGDALWVRVTLDVDDGANSVATFYTSTDSTNDDTAVSWVQLGTTDTDVVTSIYDGSAALVVGAQTSGVDEWEGTIYQAQIYDGIDGTLAVDFNAQDFVSGSTLTSSTTGEVWTANGASAFTGQWTLNGNTFIQNTGQDVVHSIGSAGLETTAGQDIANPKTVFCVARFADASLTADQYLIAPRSNTLKNLLLYADDPDDDFSLYQGLIISTGSYDTSPHVFTMQANGNSTTKLVISSLADVTADAGAEVWDYGTIFAGAAGTNPAKGYIAQLIVFDRALSETEIQAVQSYLAEKYLLES